MNPFKITSRSRVLLVSLVLAYVWGVALGNFVHNLLHHIGDQRHQHSVPCLTEGLTETPFDDSMALAREGNITAGDCAFKLGLHNLSRSGDGKCFQSVVLQMPAYPAPVFFKSDTIWVKNTLASSISSRGPPVRI